MTLVMFAVAIVSVQAEPCARDQHHCTALNAPSALGFELLEAFTVVREFGETVEAGGLNGVRRNADVAVLGAPVLLA